MSRSQKVQRLRDFLQTQGRSLVAESGADQSPGRPGWDLVFEVPTGLAFLRVVEPGDQLEESWYHAQVEIAALRDRRFGTGWLPDLYLVLLVDPPAAAVSPAAQAIMQDPYVSRKILLAWDDDLSSLFARMPFWPLQLPPATLQDLPSVRQSMSALGYDGALLEALATTGDESLAQQLLAGQLRLQAAVSDKANPAAVVAVAPWAPRRSALTPAQERIRLCRLEVEGFRGFLERRTLDLTGDLIAIYAPNGTGKTAICEAIEWGLTGAVERVGAPGHDAPADAPTPLKHAEAPLARVAVTARVGGREQTILAHASGGASLWHFQGEPVDAEKRTIARALGALLPDERSAARIRRAYHRYHYLHQHQPAILSDRPDARFEIFQMLVGTTEYEAAERRIEGVLRVLARTHEEAMARAEAERQAVTQGRVEIQLLQQRLDMRAQSLPGIDRERTVAGITDRARALGLLPPAQGGAGAGAAGATPLELAALLQSVLPHAREQARDESDRLAALLPLVRVRSRWAERQAQLEAEQAAHRSGQDGSTAAQADVRQQLAQLEREAQSLNELVADRRRRLAALGQLIELAPLITAAQDRLAEGRRQADGLSQQADQADADADQAEAALREQQALLARAEQTLSALEQQRHRLQGLRATHAQWLRLRQQEAHGAAQVTELTGALQAAGEGLAALRRQEGDLRTALDEARFRGAALAQRLTRRQELLSALQSHLDESHCPLCRTGFDSIQELHEAVRASLDQIPVALTEAGQQQQALESDLAGLQERLGRLDGRRAEHESALNALKSRMAGVESARAQAEQVLRAELGPLAPDDLPAELTGLLDALQVSEAEARVKRQPLAEQVRQLAGLAEQATARRERLAADRAAALALVTQRTQALAQLEAEAATLDLTATEREAPAAAAGRYRSELARAEAHLSQLGGALHDARGRLAALVEQAQAMADRLAAIDGELNGLAIAFADLQGRLRATGLEPAADVAAVERAAQVAATRLQALDQLARDLTIVKELGTLLQEQTNLTGMKERLAVQERRLAQLDAEVDRIARLAAGCRELLGQIRGVRRAIEAEREVTFKPFFKHLYRRLSAHPYFGEVELAIDAKSRTLKIQVSHPGDPGQTLGGVTDFFSEAQMNVVRLSLFLTQALLQGWSGLQTIIIDDPVQHMDDMNAFFLLDLLHSLAAANKQIIITTSDRRLYKLMLVKFAVLNQQGATRFRALRLRGIGGGGPAVIDDSALITVGAGDRPAH